jgi:beta-glucanase (GH16 family)
MTIRYKFRDEFAGPAGSAPSSRWHYAIGGGGWGNKELQVYTNSRANSFLDGNGHLVIRAIKTAEGGFTSARLFTDPVMYHGTWEARFKVNIQRGCWPAWWMMGQGGNWPLCGEIDVFENYGWTAGQTSVHTPDGAPDGMRSTSTDFPLDNAWHVYRMTWDDNGLRFAKDGSTYKFVAPADLAPWVFSNGKPLFMLANLAVGGSVGAPPPTVEFPVDMLIDYVRVW